MKDLSDIWLLHHRRLGSFLCRRLGDCDAADDLLQNVFLRMHLNLHTLKDPGRLEAWMFCIARHVLADHFRSQGSRPLPFCECFSPSTEAEERHSRASVVAPAIRRSIFMLPPEYRQALIMTALKGKSQKELARVAGLSLSGAKSRVQRARRRVKRMLRCPCVQPGAHGSA